MSDDHDPSTTPVEQNGLAYEPDAIDSRAIVKWGAALAVVVAASLLGMAALIGGLDYFASQQQATRSPTFLGAEPPSESPDDAIQVARVKELREQQVQRLEKYAWVDRERQIVQVPIGVAMKLLEEGAMTTQTQTRESRSNP